MIEVTLVSNDGDGEQKVYPVAEGVTLEDFLRLTCERNVVEGDDHTVRVRSNGTSTEPDYDYILQHGDRVSVAPKKIDGGSR
ncbi:MAG: hypothetical protein JSW11_00895 [Candidatus Heimdallarchaeota archaeon]|nr:MAG: hypothetical protein JSW11_00895 [Candidatus Heimdallarchaeota archaeon]